VALVRTDVSEEPGASFIRVTKIGELGTTTDFCHPDEGGARFLRNVGSYKSHTQKTPFLMELLAGVCGPCHFYLLGKLERLSMKQFTTFSKVNCNNFPEICLKEFRHVSHQKAGILNIFCDGEYSISYYI
jgi:hypothetical protein